MATKLSAIKKIVMNYVNVLMQNGIKVEKVILYGSQAKGTAHKDSDIDIIIISSDLKKYNFPERLSLLSRATLNVKGALEIIGYTQEEIENRKGESVFWDEICSNGKEIYRAV